MSLCPRRGGEETERPGKPRVRPLNLVIYRFEIRLHCYNTRTIAQLDHIGWKRFESKERHYPSSLVKVLAAIYANCVAKPKGY